MAAEVIDLDQLIDEPKLVSLGGSEYKLPSDLPIPTVLRLQRLQSELDEGGDQDEVGVRLYEMVVEIFQVHQPELETIPLTALQLANFINRVYGVEEPDEGKPDPTPARTGTAKKKRASRTKSRSSSS